MPCSANSEQPANEPGIAPAFTAVLPQSIDPRFNRPVSDVIDLVTYELQPHEFAHIRRATPDHVFAKYTYFAKCAGTGNIKIGRAFDPEVRMRQLKKQVGHAHELLATVRGGENESSYHMVFAAHRLHGEWFEPHPDILAEIERLRGAA